MRPRAGHHKRRTFVQNGLITAIGPHHDQTGGFGMSPYTAESDTDAGSSNLSDGDDRPSVPHSDHGSADEFQS